MKSRSAPSLWDELTRAPARSVRWLASAPVAIILFFAWTTVHAVAMVIIALAWRAWLVACRADIASARWQNPAQRLFRAWAGGLSVLASTLWGMRHDPDAACPSLKPGQVGLALMTHGPAIPAMLQLSRLIIETGDLRFLAPTKHNLTPVLLWPGVAAGMLLPLNREAGESAAEALARELEVVPLEGAVLAIFPEGHRPKRKNWTKSAQRARARGYEPLRHLNEPRPRGAYTMVSVLNERARAEGLELRIFFGAYSISRAGWGERLGPLHSAGARVSTTWEDVTDQVRGVSHSLPEFGRWLRDRFEGADAAMSPSPFLDPQPIETTHVSTSIG